MAKNNSGRTPAWAFMGEKNPNSKLPPKGKGKVERITKFELWSNGTKVGVWETARDKMAERKAIQALASLKENSYFRLIEVSRWTDNRERSKTIQSGFKE